MAENFRTVSVVFAADNENNLYKLARFTERGLGDDYEIWSHSEEHHGWLFDGFNEKIKRDGDYFEPITKEELSYYMKSPSSKEGDRVTKMLNVAKFTIPIKAFYFMRFEFDRSYHIFNMELQLITKDSEACTTVLPKEIENLCFPNKNSELFILTFGKQIETGFHRALTLSNEYIGEWCRDFPIDVHKYIDNTSIFSKLCERGNSLSYIMDGSGFESIDEALVIGWTYADESHCILTSDGIRFTKIHNNTI